MPSITERPLSGEEKSEFEARSTKALTLLGADSNELAPEALVKLVDVYVDKWQTGGFAPRRTLFGRKPAQAAMPDSVDLALGLGAVWGDQVVKRFGWEWVCIQQEGQELYCVASPNRAWVIYPTYFLKACLDNPQIDCTTMLSFNMMAAGSLPDGEVGSYENVMDGVVRIVPRR